MRNKERLDFFYEELKFIHKEFYQDLRFGQFITALTHWIPNNYDIDIFHLEEDEFIKYARAYAKVSHLYKGQYDWVKPL